jgi:SHS2 domain-containing protein
MTQRFEELPHTADLSIHVWGRDLAALFANAAHGMAHLLAAPGDVVPARAYPIELQAPDVETLLVSWLEELLYLGERDDVLFVRFEVERVTEGALRAVAHGGPVAGYRRSIKAVTFSGLEVVSTDAGCETTIVFDV